MILDKTRPQFVLLALGGIAFIAGGAMHPGDSGKGTKIEQLHEMLVQPSWYPAHALLLVGVAGFACGALAMRGLGPAGLQRLVQVVCVIALLNVAGMAVHLLEALNAPHLADGEGNLLSSVQVFNETVLNTAWALGFVALAVTGGLTRSIGNVVTAALGLVGGGAFALASATIAFTDRFDVLFPIGSLLGLWAVAIGLRYAVAKPAGRRDESAAAPRAAP